ncbi:MAG: amino acid adenylation domain-containing protein [bacterium]
MSASFAQSRLWFLDRFEPGDPVYHIPLAVRLRGKVNQAALERSLVFLVQRHETLRTTFGVEAGNVVQIIHPAGPRVALAITAPEPDLALADQLSTEARRPFDLINGPLWRAVLWRLSAEEHVLQLTLHHIISDGWSLGVLIKEFSAAYAQADYVPAELSVHYADFAAWQNEQLSGPALDQRIATWRDRLAGADFTPPLVTDYPRAKSRSTAGATEVFTLDPPLTAQLKSLSQAGGGSLFMALLTGFAAVLQRWSGRDDLIIGTPVANRTRAEIEPLIGFFVNALPLRISLDNDPTGAELFKRVANTALAALEDQDLPFEKLVQELQPDRSTAYTPLFQVMFVLQNAPMGELQMADLTASPEEVDTATSKFDLTVVLAESTTGLSGRIEYASELFAPGTIARFARHFTAALQALAAHPTRPLSQLQLAGDAEQQQLQEWSTGPTPSYPDTSIATVFATAAAQYPEAIAVNGAGRQLTYATVEARANQLAHALQAQGVGPDVPVGVLMERSPDIVVALLGILKAGGAYLALDPAYPAARLTTILQSAACSRVVTSLEQRPTFPAEVAAWDLAKLMATATGLPTTAPDLTVGPDHLAYISFTSGSTGTPKGVAVPHRAVLRLVHGDGFMHFGPEEVFLLMAPLAFDASTLELWGPLLHGGRLAVMPPGRVTLEQIGEVVRREKVTSLWLTAGLFNLMIDERSADLAGVRQLLAGGDVLSLPHVAKALAALPNTRLINGYGPTENTTFTCCHQITAADLERRSIPIGTPISHTTVEVLDAALRPAPIGVPGDLYTGGDGLARGYVGDPDLTAAAFIPHPRDPLKRLYRTGDRARWLADGTVEFLGRADRQIKIRGYRIEPGEVEAALAAEPEVTGAAVVVTDGRTGKRLIGYVSPQIDTDSLQQRLAARLPPYLVPSVLIALDALPLNPNGKVDRAALPVPEPDSVDRPFTPPRTATEEILGHLWARLLEVDRVGSTDDFFTLGGHSLLATQLVSRVREAFAIELALRAVFESPTLAQLAGHIEAQRRDQTAAAPPLIATARPTALPLSFAQERLWFLNQLEPGNPFYNMPAALELSGKFDLPAARRVVQALTARHESLRTVFRAADGHPTQVVLPDGEIPVTLEDLSLSPPETRDSLVQRAIATEARRPFDLAQGPLLRVVILRLQDDHHILLMTMHHIVSDGWSMGVLTREMGEFYASFTGAESVLPAPLQLHYADYAIWQRRWLTGTVFDTQLTYWKEQLADTPPVLTLPGDRPRPATQSYRGGSHTFKLDAELTAGLTALSRATGATLFMILEAAFAVLLGRMSRQQDVLIGTPIANRHRAEVEPLIGFFVNTLVLRNDLSGEPSFRDLIERTRNTALDAYAHQDLPFERLVDELQPERDLSRNPIFQVMFALHNTPNHERVLPELTITDLAAERISAQFDIVLDVWENPSGLKAVLEFATDLFDGATIQRMADHFTILLRGIVADPDVPVHRLPWLSEAERVMILDTFNDTSMPYPDHQTLAQLITAQAQLTPDAVAGRHRNKVLTYAELNQRANVLAHHLIGLGVDRGDFVGVLDERGLDFLIGLVAILKAGAAFIPIDPGYPADRVQHMLSDSGVSTLLTRSAIAARCRATEAGAELKHVVLFDAAVAESPDPAGRIRMHPREQWIGGDSSDPGVTGAADDAAYMLYTSGSTGRPKGAIIRHNGAINHIYGQFRELNFHAGSAFLQSAPSSSDISVWQFLAPLLIGGRTVIADFEVVCEAPRLFELVRDEGITLFEFVPVVLKAFLDHAATLPEGGPLPALEYGMVTGEAVPVALINQWFERYPQIPLANAYGPTEAADDICQALLTAPLPADTPTVPIGRPLPNLTLYVLDDTLALMPIGVPGEICVSGVGVGAGYWRNPEKTAAAFVPNPYAANGRGEVLYRTGDLGRWLPDGNLEMLGRFDQQVKLRGFRIELGEIESMIGQHPGVAETIVQIQSDPSDEDRLVAWLTPDDAAGELRAQLDRLQVDQVSLWQDLHEDSYRDTLTYADNDPTFNVIGWDSNYTRKPLSENEMREYVGHTVDQVRKLAPRRILEIGVGTGLLMFPLAKDCEHYLACDLSTVAIDQLRDLTRNRTGYDGLELRAQSAHDFTGVDPASYDVVMLCSVVQYFPGISYLMEVIEGALKVLRPGGAIFLGDVRVLSLLPAFHASVQLYHAGETLTAAGLQRRVREALQSEQEMAVDPAFFAALRSRFPSISRVQIRPKRATVHNEMTRFRADVTLHVDADPGTPIPATATRINWTESPVTLADIRAQLSEWNRGAEHALVLEAIANIRVQREVATLSWLEHAPAQASVAEFRQELDARPSLGLEPEEVLTLADELGVSVDLAQTGEDGAFVAVFRSGDASNLPPLELWPIPETIQPWRTYANHPLHEKLARFLVPQVRNFLRERLPSHMIPADFVVLESFPQLPNGKIDRKSLPAPERAPASSIEDYVAPANPTESKLAAIWTSVLGLAQVGVTANFFELGGHSLKATQVVSRIRQELGTEIPLREMFNQPTIRELATAVLQRRRSEIVPLPRIPDAKDYPLSHAQVRLWVLAQMEGALVAYNMPVSLELQGKVDREAMAHAFAGLIQRHESLRTTLPEINGEPRQRVHPQPLAGLTFTDLSADPDPEAAAQETALNDALSPFDLAQGPLVRLTLLRLSPTRHALLFNIHHIISDDWSMGVLVREFTQRYDALAAGKTLTLPPLAAQYRDYTAWQHARHTSRAMETQRAFWHDQLAGKLPVLDLSTDYPRPPIKTYRGRTLGFTLSAEITATLGELARRHHSSLFMVLTTAVHVFLHRHTQQDDIIVGTPMAGRHHPDLEDQIGFYINTLPLRAKIAPPQPFVRLLEQVRETVTNAFEHQDYPFDRIVDDLAVDRDVSRSPLFDVVVVMQNVDEYELHIDNVEITPLLDDVGGSKFDLQFNFAESDGRLECSIGFNTDLFAEERITRYTEHFVTLVESITLDPQQPIHQLNLLPSAERRRILHEFNPAPVTLPAPSDLVTRFQNQVRRTPDGVAVHLPGDPGLTYRELDEQSDRLARHLLTHGVGAETPVGLFLGRGPQLLVGLIGILKSGGAYVPIDPVYPAERIAFILKDANAPVILTDTSLRSQLPPIAATVIDIDQLGNAAHDSSALEVPVPAPTQAAYIIYTSGSTGTPKGCVINHHQAVRLFDATDPWFHFSSEDVGTLFHSHAFDFSVWEIWGALLFGGRLVIVPHTTSRDPEAFLTLLRQENVTVLNQTPSAFNQLSEADALAPTDAKPLALRTIIFGGEALDLSSLRGWWGRHGDESPRLVNMYGITETTVHVTYRPLSRSDLAGAPASVIGQAIPDLKIYLLDPSGAPVPIGVTGEIHVGGAGVARGYLRRPELTNERFVADPFSTDKTARLYKSGDLARWLPDGDLEYLGRSDHQIKIRGFRIELGEIESALTTHPSLSAAIVVARYNSAEDLRLHAYFTVSAGQAIPSTAALRDHLSAHLPSYMIPAAFLRLEALPLTANGKIDRDALPALETVAAAPTRGPVAEKFEDELEATIAGLWAEALGIDQVSRHDNFFDLGGHSLLIVQVHKKLRAQLEIDFNVTLLFKHASVAALAVALRNRATGATAGDPTLPAARARADRQKAARQNRRRGGPRA